METDPTYEVRIGKGALGEVAAAAGKSFALVSDANVAPLYGALGLGEVAHVLPPGEDAKTFASLERLLDTFTGLGLDRNSRVIALGGGTVGDVAGLAGALYMRGIDVIQCPTTLLAMVDASIGGKTAINLVAGKNLAGVVHQPRAVFADLETLATLTREEFRSGLGEVVKSALIGDAALLDLLEQEAEALQSAGSEALEEVVFRCVSVKARVVGQDEHETDRRRVLNLGHTFSHAFEHVAGYGTIPHGIAVAVGLVLALDASERIGLLQDTGLVGRVRALNSRLGLPASIAELRSTYGVALPGEGIARAMTLDKKAHSGELRYVLVESAGDVRTDLPLPAGTLERLLAE